MPSTKRRRGSTSVLCGRRSPRSSGNWCRPAIKGTAECGDEDEEEDDDDRDDGRGDDRDDDGRVAAADDDDDAAAFGGAHPVRCAV